MGEIISRFPSIFDLIKEKNYQYYNTGQESENWSFENFNLDRITYPISGGSENKFPEESKLRDALERCGENVLLVSGDFSGIQDTVYTISSKGALKTLRARSFMLELLCEHIALELITAAFKVPTKDYAKRRNHIVFVGGGSFCLVLPDENAALARIGEFKELINSWAYDEFGGKLYIALSYLSVSAKELNDSNKFKSHWEQLSESLELDKQRKFSWKFAEIFNEIREPQQRTDTEECQICHRDDIIISSRNPFFSLNSFSKIENRSELTKIAEEDDVAHELCYRLFRLGDDLTKIDEIFRTHEPPESNIEGYLKFPRRDGGWAYYCVKKPINNIEFRWLVNRESQNDSSAPFFYAKYVRQVKQLPESANKKEKLQAKEDKIKIADESTASFTGLAYAACGADFVGCLRMDVDNLGKVFTDKMANFTLITISHLSRMLNVFFKVYINFICAGQLNLPDDTQYKPNDLSGKKYDNDLGTERKEFNERKKGASGRNVSVVYSGGDDLMIIGAWDEVVELAYDIQYCFSRFSGLGISGGLTVHKPKYPLYQMAKISGDAEKQAKSFKLYSERYNEPQKNNFAPFYSPFYKQKNIELNERYKELQRNGEEGYPDKLMPVLSWDESLHRLIVENFIKNFTDQQGDHRELKEHISRGFIYKLFKLSEVWWEHGILYVPQFMYLAGRIKKSFKNDTITSQNFDRLINDILRMPLKNNKHQTIRTLKILLTWIDLYLRRKGDKL